MGDRGEKSLDVTLAIVLIIIALVIGQIVSSCVKANAGTLHISFSAPTTVADNPLDQCGLGFDSTEVDPMTLAPIGSGSPIEDLKDFLVFGKRFKDSDTLQFAGSIPYIPGKTDKYEADLDIQDGSMGSVWVLARNYSNQLSCKGSEKTFAIPLTEGIGLASENWNGRNFSTLVSTQIDSTIDFDWGLGAGWTGGPTDYFSKRYKGKLNVPTPGTYTLYVFSDDGIRMWVDGALVQDVWVPRQAETSCVLQLTGGQHDFQLDYFEEGGAAKLKLYWSGPGISKRIISKAYLTP